MISPKFNALSLVHKSIKFLSCDVDNAKDVAQQFRITAMPTFIVLKGNKILEEVSRRFQNGSREREIDYVFWAGRLDEGR